MRLLVALVSGLGLLAFAARAQPIQGLYIGAGAGGNFLAAENVRPSAGLRTPQLQAVFGPGFVGLGSVGYAFGNGWRIEIEGNYRRNTLDRLTGTAFPTSAGGSQETYGAMANALFDLDIGVPWLFPYMGGGAGYAWSRWRGVRATDAAGTDVVAASGTAGNFAYQAIGGVAFPVPHAPGLSITAEYRFMGVLGQQSFTGSSVGFGPPGSGGNLNIKTNFNHAVMLGLRYAFSVAPPPAPAPPAAPAPAPARSYLVFFDWDRATLTDRARQVVADAAANIAKVAHTRIEVNGYTDTSGTPQYNMGLSIRRAQAVAAELVRLGVTKDQIAIQGFGETRLLVATGPGVREPQNRRVEIIIR